MGSTQEKEFVELTLVSAYCFAVVFANLMVAQIFKRLACPSRSLKEPLLLITLVLKAEQFPLHEAPLLKQRRFPRIIEEQLSRSCAGR
jgi:hypothetical protein